MKQFMLAVPPDKEGMVSLAGKDFHYLVRVRRVKAGSVVDAALPDGKKVRLDVLSVGRESLSARSVPAADVFAVETSAEDNSPAPAIVLFQALPRGAKMDVIVRQAAESGVLEIAPFVSEYSQIRLDAFSRTFSGRNPAREKQSRWERIIREARQQSGSPVPTRVREPCGVDGLLEYWHTLKEAENASVGILLHQAPLENGTFHDYLSSNPRLVVLAVGPEGGFSPEEAARFIAAGFKPLVLGNTILRTETAALYGAAAIRIIAMENASWQLKTPLSCPAENVSRY